MSEENIGVLTLIGQARMDGLAAGYAKAEKLTTSFVASANEKLSGVGIGLKGALGVAGIGVGLAAAGRSLLGFAENVDKTGDMADRLGTTTAKLSELRYAAQLTGSESSALDGALQKMNANLGDAATKGGPAADAIRTLGLDAGKLAAMDPADAFRAIAGGFQGIANPAQRAALSMDIFGKTGQSLLNTLAAGPGEIDRLSDEFRKFGGSVSEAQRQGVGMMFDSLDRLGAAVSGVGTRLAVELSPYVTAATDEMVRMATEGGGLGQAITGAMEGITLAVAGAADMVGGLAAAFQSAGAIMDATLIHTTKLLQNFGLVASAVSQDQLDGLLVESGKKLNEAFGGESWSSKVEKSLMRIRDRAKEAAGSAAKVPGALAPQVGGKPAKEDKVGGMLGGLERERIATTRGDDAAKLFDLKKAGASTDQLRKAAETLKEIGRAKDLEKLKGDADRLGESLLTPVEKAQRDFDKLGKMRDAGLISDEMFGRGAGKIRDDLKGDADKGMREPQYAGAIDSGSKEAYDAILKASATLGGDQSAEAKKQSGLQSQMVGFLNTIASGVKAKQPAAAPQVMKI